MPQINATVMGIADSDVPSPGPPKLTSVLLSPGNKCVLMPSLLLLLPLLPRHRHFLRMFAGFGAKTPCKSGSRPDPFDGIHPHGCNVFAAANDGDLVDSDPVIAEAPNPCREDFDETRAVPARSPIGSPVQSDRVYLHVGRQGFCPTARTPPRALNSG